MACLKTDDKQEQINIPSQLALRPTWRPEMGRFQESAPCSLDPDVEPDFAKLMRAISRDASFAGVEELCSVLRVGDLSTRESACDHGAIKITGELLARSDNVPIKAMEALWLLVDDGKTWQAFAGCGGQTQVLKLARERGSQDASFACNSLRLLSETLYFEEHDSPIWRDLDFIIDALGWALTADASEASAADLACILLCDIAALWVHRASRVGIEAAKALVGIIPLLLQKIARRTDDRRFMQHGCRLLQALAKCSNDWPEDLRTPTLAALVQLSQILQCTDPFVAGNAQSALEAVYSVREAPPVVLMAMD